MPTGQGEPACAPSPPLQVQAGEVAGPLVAITHAGSPVNGHFAAAAAVANLAGGGPGGRAAAMAALVPAMLLQLLASSAPLARCSRRCSAGADGSRVKVSESLQEITCCVLHPAICRCLPGSQGDTADVMLF